VFPVRGKQLRQQYVFPSVLDPYFISFSPKLKVGKSVSLKL
jgi:hypothetical protein